MLTRYISKSHLPDYVATQDHAAGDIVFFGSLAAQVTASCKAGDRVGVRVDGIIEATKGTLEDYALGVSLKWKDNQVFPSTSPNALNVIGICI